MYKSLSKPNWSTLWLLLAELVKILNFAIILFLHCLLWSLFSFAQQLHHKVSLQQLVSPCMQVELAYTNPIFLLWQKLKWKKIAFVCVKICLILTMGIIYFLDIFQQCLPLSTVGYGRKIHLLLKFSVVLALIW